MIFYKSAIDLNANNVLEKHEKAIKILIDVIVRNVSCWCDECPAQRMCEKRHKQEYPTNKYCRDTIYKWLAWEIKK